MAYNKKYHQEWYKKNRDRLLVIRKEYNKKYFKRPEVIERARIKNATPYFKSLRKKYKNSPRGRAADRRSREKNWPKELLRLQKNRLMSRYGMTVDQYNLMLKDQKKRCLICDNKKNKFHVDHCHKTNKVRGLLCTKCNLGLGLFGDDIIILARAIRYLKKCL